MIAVGFGIKMDYSVVDRFEDLFFVSVTPEATGITPTTTYDTAERVQEAGVYSMFGGLAVMYSDVIYNAANHFLNGGETIFGKIGEYAAATSALGLAALAVSSLALRLVDRARAVGNAKNGLEHGPKDVL